MYRFILALILFSNVCNAQTPKIESIVSQKPLQVKHIVRDTNNVVKVFLKSDFAEQFIKDTVGMNRLKHSTIVQIDLVYSKFKSVENFDQQRLNEKRLKQLSEWLPKVFTNDKIKWRLIEQTEGNDVDKAAKLFHGFVFWLSRDSIDIGYTSETTYLREVMKMADKDIPLTCNQQVKELLAARKLPAPPYLNKRKGGLKEYLKASLVFPTNIKVKKANVFLTYHIRMNENGSVDTFYLLKSKGGQQQYINEANEVLQSMPIWKPSDTITTKVKYDYVVRVYYNSISKKKKFVTVTVSSPIMISLCKPDPVTPPMIYTYNIPIHDSTVLKVLKRNSQWNDMLIVGDFTGSMSPYSAQLLVWYQLMLSGSKNKVKYFTFFNDGDNKPDGSKKIGSTGGIYGGKAGTITELKELAYKTMDAGSGGDAEENNIEALIAAIKSCPDCKDLIMMSDNFETPRDMSLLKYVSRPVKVILCGTSIGVNTAYLDIARQTGGSVHTIEEDIGNLAALHEGETIKIGKETFRITNGKFVKTFKS